MMLCKNPIYEDEKYFPDRVRISDPPGSVQEMDYKLEIGEVYPENERQI